MLLDPIARPQTSLTATVFVLLAAGLSVAYALGNLPDRRSVMSVRREPVVLLLALIVPVVQAVMALSPVAPEAAGLVNAVAVAAAGAGAAALVRSDKLLPALTGLAQAVLALVVGLGMQWSSEQQALILAPITILLGFWVRGAVDAPVDADGAERALTGGRIIDPDGPNRDDRP